MKCPVTYLYTLSNENNEIFYIGKTKSPYNRFTTHYSKINYPFIMEIVKEYYDEEDKLIVELLTTGKNISNLQLPYNPEGEYNIGLKFSSNDIKSKNKPIFDKKLKRIFNTIRECAEYYNVEPYTISNHLRGINTIISKDIELEYKII